LGEEAEDIYEEEAELNLIVIQSKIKMVIFKWRVQGNEDC
jgi:hypothetical protein